MYWLLLNQHYQHRTNQKLRSWANAVFQNRGVLRASVSFAPFPLPPHSFLFCSRPNFLAETLAMQAKMVVESFSNKWCEKRAMARERLFCTPRNSPFYSYRWKRGWSWRCFGTNLPDYYANYVVLMLTRILLSIISIRKGKRFVSKQGQAQPHVHSKARMLSPQL